jgi:multicomponent Na+:H+ antiporter subunit A
VILIFAGAFTKSAQFPFHFWLPNAMEAPTPVSAYLHSATMVKAGVFLLARTSPILGGTAVWTETLTIVGALTAVYSAAVALTKNDLKQVLAYTTVMALGVCMMFLGLPVESGEPPASLIAAVTFVVVHALYKAALFMVAGTIDHSTGTRDIRWMGGLRQAMPWTFAAAVLAALSMAGVPPFLGFVGKELLYSSVLASPRRTTPPRLFSLPTRSWSPPHSSSGRHRLPALSRTRPAMRTRAVGRCGSARSP